MFYIWQLQMCCSDSWSQGGASYAACQTSCPDCVGAGRLLTVRCNWIFFLKKILDLVFFKSCHSVNKHKVALIMG